MDEWDYWIGKIAGKSRNYRHLEVFLAGKLIYCLGGWSLNPPDHISEQIYSIMFVDLYVEVKKKKKKGRNKYRVSSTHIFISIIQFVFIKYTIMSYRHHILYSM